MSKRVLKENTARQFFWRTNISCPPQFFRPATLFKRDFRTCTYQGVKNVRFSEKFGVLCFLKSPTLRFVFLLYYRRNELHHKKFAAWKASHFEAFLVRIIIYLFCKCPYSFQMREIREYFYIILKTDQKKLWVQTLFTL